MSGSSYLERATAFYRRLWADNGTHSEEYIIAQIANLIRDSEQNIQFMGWILIFPAFVAGVVSGIAVIFLALLVFH